MIKGKQTVGSTVTVTASITYPCPKPFDTAMFPASDSFTSISLPAGMTLVGPSPQLSLGTMNAGESAVVSWTVHIDKKSDASSISVTAGGLVSGSVPDAWWNGQTNYYPAYDYTDMIGGTGFVSA